MTELRSISSTELRAVFVVDGVEQAVQMRAAAAANRRNKCFIPGLSGMPGGIPVFFVSIYRLCVGFAWKEKPRPGSVPARRLQIDTIAYFFPKTTAKKPKNGRNRKKSKKMYNRVEMARGACYIK